MFCSSLCAPGRSAVVVNGPSVTIYNHKLPEDVLLEIFEAYRQLYELEPNYETLWNSRDGWFKLAHVCVHWRRVLLSSSSRLNVHLLFTPRRPSQDPLLRYLPRLPILVDYSTAFWATIHEENLALAVMGHRSRVRGITLGSCPERFLWALSRPYPKLESLHICPRNIIGSALPAISLPSLRRLTLRGVALTRTSPLLASATGLVELALNLSVGYGTLPEGSLLANLQRMSCLRRLELKLSYIFQGIAIFPSPSPSAGDAVPLSQLTDITFMGHCSYLQMLVVGLAAPSLQRLDVEIYRAATIFSIPHLCRFICDTENQFIVLSLNLFQEKLQVSADTIDHAQSFKITFPRPSVPLEEIGNMLSGPFSTVEELVVECHLCQGVRFGRDHHIQWGGFFNYVGQVKTVQLPFETAHEVTHSFQQGSLLDFLPSLEQVNVGFKHLPPRKGRYAKEFKTIRDAFKPLIAARQQAGRPIMLSRV
jgi:hypothetical protein